MRASTPSLQKDKSTGIYHYVKPGQTLWSIARAYGVEVRTLVRFNELSDANVLHIGLPLYIPGATRRYEVESRCPCPPKAPPTAARREASPRAPSSPDPLLTSRQEQTIEHVAFVWPLHGNVKRGLDQEEPYRHHGIEIMAPQHTPIQAAADGEVIFSGWGPEGYGRMVIVQHPADLVTIYAHNDRNLVSQGARVRQGDYIATVGHSGRTKRDALHFEIRHKTVPVPPEQFLPRRHPNTVFLMRLN